MLGIFGLKGDSVADQAVGLKPPALAMGGMSQQAIGPAIADIVQQYSTQQGFGPAGLASLDLSHGFVAGPCRLSHSSSPMKYGQPAPAPPLTQGPFLGTIAAMKILVVIPHYFGGDKEGGDNTAINRSMRPNARHERTHALTRVLASLQTAFGPHCFGLNHSKGRARRVKQDHQIDVIIVTLPDAHLLSELPASVKSGFRHATANCDPLRLGFVAHRILGEEGEKYDYSVYLEDDVAIHDPLFFRKRRAFDTQFGPEALLQPQRYEVGGRNLLRKLYVDWAVTLKKTVTFQNIADRPRISFDFGGDLYEMKRTSYPSSGCFILSDEQRRLWRQSPSFLDGDESYFSPLDSAATLSVMKTFRIYKPCLDHSWFFEVEHVSPRWISLLEPNQA